MSYHARFAHFAAFWSSDTAGTSRIERNRWGGWSRINDAITPAGAGAIASKYLAAACVIVWNARRGWVGRTRK